MKTNASLLAALAETLKQFNLKLAVAESCTGGMLSSLLTSIPGSSGWYDRGFVTYTNQAKHEMLGVPQHILDTFGAVSEASARAMAEGAIQHSDAEVSVAITGIAGPTGGTPDKPVGTVWIAWAGARAPTHAVCFTFSGNRENIRKATVHEALKGLKKRLSTYIAPHHTPRYFFALFPDDTTITHLQQQTNYLTEQSVCRPTPKHQLHLTLAYLGALTHDECTRMEQILTHCPIAPFELTLDGVNHLTNHHVLYAKPRPSDALHMLHAFINQALLEQGFKPERRAFLPHVTLARKFKEPIKTTSIVPHTWFIHDACLIASKPQHETSNYTLIKRSPLKLA